MQSLDYTSQRLTIKAALLFLGLAILLAFNFIMIFLSIFYSCGWLRVSVITMHSISHQVKDNSVISIYYLIAGLSESVQSPLLKSPKALCGDILVLHIGCNRRGILAWRR